MTIQIAWYHERPLDGVVDDLRSVYQVVFTQPPWNEPQSAVDAFPERITKHAQRSGFRCWVATATETGRVAGFAYGFQTTPGEWWHDTVTAGLPPDTIQRWFTNAFELVELAVHPDYQGRGVGSALHTHIVQHAAPHPIVTSTDEHDNPAVQFYRQRGWHVVRAGFHYPGHSETSLILGFTTL